MEFWGVEVKSGQPLPVTPGEGMILHLSQANLGELKKEKGSESICLFLKVDGKTLVLGTLFTEKLPQQLFDLVFDRGFELSHNWKNGSIFFYGYKTSNPLEEDPPAITDFEDGESDESDSDEAIPFTVSNNGKPETTVKQEKPAGLQKSNAVKNNGSHAGKQKVKIVEPNKDMGDDESTDDDLMSEEDDEDDSKDDDDSDNSDENSDGNDEETPKKAEPSKKRAAESAAKTPVADKKAKANQQKTDSKKDGSHVDTPYPTKQGGKAAANKPNQQTPKSVGSHACKSCNRKFNSENALESHSKAKHSSGK